MSDLVPPVEFYLDFACPHSYLACVRLRETALRTGAKIVWKPFLLADLAAAVGDALQPVYDSDPRRAAYQAAELAWWARYNAVELNRKPGDEIDSGPALQGLVGAAAGGRAMDYALAVFAACFDGCENIADQATLAAVARRAGLEPDAPDASETRRVLAANARSLAERGGFSSATLFVEEHMFVGHTRMPLVEFALGQASTRQFVMPGQHG